MQSHFTNSYWQWEYYSNHTPQVEVEFTTGDKTAAQSNAPSEKIACDAPPHVPARSSERTRRSVVRLPPDIVRGGDHAEPSRLTYKCACSARGTNTPRACEADPIFFWQFIGCKKKLRRVRWIRVRVKVKADIIIEFLVSLIVY